MSPEGENRPMTPEYVALSYRAGMFARLADLVLGGDDFEIFTRFHGWSITPQLLIEMQSAAMTLGVPAKAIQEAEETAAYILPTPGFIAAALRVQAQRDAARKGSHAPAN